METLRTVDLSEGKFECGGKTYHVCTQLSFARYPKLQELLLEFTFSATPIDIFNCFRVGLEGINQKKDGDAAIAMNNGMKGIEKMNKHSIPALKICALFWNVQGEDLTDASDAMIDSKISEWGKELDINPFFHQALALSPDSRAVYLHYIQNISQSQLILGL
jgi:hypothetical protein